MPKAPEWDARMRDSLTNLRVMGKHIIRLERLEAACQCDSERARIRLDRQQQEAMLLSYLGHMEQGLAEWRRVVDGWSTRYGKQEPSIRQLRLLIGGRQDDEQAA